MSTKQKATVQGLDRVPENGKAGSMELASLPDIQKVAEQIAERFHPQKIVLFGSYAHNEATPDSDVDLLVVMEADDSPLRTAAEIAAALDHPFPLDILVWAPDKWQASVERGGTFATEVATRGVLLYEAGD